MHIKEVSVTLDICSYLEAGDRPATLILAASSTRSNNVGNNRGATVLVHLADEDFGSMPRFELCPTGRGGGNRNQYMGRYKIVFQDSFCSAFSTNESKSFYAMMKDDKKAALRLYILQ